jgi:hypothetical protein
MPSLAAWGIKHITRPQKLSRFDRFRSKIVRTWNMKYRARHWTNSVSSTLLFIVWGSSERLSRKTKEERRKCEKFEGERGNLERTLSNRTVSTLQIHLLYIRKPFSISIFESHVDFEQSDTSASISLRYWYRPWQIWYLTECRCSILRAALFRKISEKGEENLPHTFWIDIVGWFQWTSLASGHFGQWF